MLPPRAALGRPEHDGVLAVPGDEAELPSHLHLTAAERRVLKLVALGRADVEVADLLDASPTAVRSVLRRFRDTSGLAGRRLVVWSVIHLECCISIAG